MLVKIGGFSISKWDVTLIYLFLDVFIVLTAKKMLDSSLIFVAKSATKSGTERMYVSWMLFFAGPNGITFLRKVKNV